MPGLLFAPKQNFGKLLIQKKGFLMSVYLLMVAQLAITAAVVTTMRKFPGLQEKVSKHFFLWLFLTIGLVLGMTLVPLPTPVKILLFAILSVLIGMTMLAASTRVPPEMIRAAIFSTLGLFVSMTVLALIFGMMGINLGFLWFVLFVALLALVIARIVAAFVGVKKETAKLLLMAGIALFSIFICFDTNQLLLSNSRDVVDGALGLYLDIVNLFSNILGLDAMED